MLVPLPTLCVRLLGDFLLTRGDTPITSVNSPRLQSLLAYLVLHHDAPQARNQLAFTFYPDTTEANARNNFRQLLFELRRALPNADRFLDIQGMTVQWRADASFTCDVMDFERAAALVEHAQDARAAFEKAIALYRGDLLPGCYDDWIAPERESLRDKFSSALDKLIALVEQIGDYPAAIDYAQRLLRHDPLHETTYRRLIRFYAAIGDRASALRTYYVCATVLQRELTVEPSADTRAEYERLLPPDARTTVTLALPGVLPLVGRQREWAQLQAAWRDAASGRAQMIVLQGEAGVGKTRLAEELIAWVNRQSIANVRAQCYSSENALAYAPIAAWLRARPLPSLDDILLLDVARLLPEALATRPDLHPTALTEKWQRQRMFASLSRAILQGNQPLALWLEDLQWCDQDTLDWLNYLLHSNPTSRLMIIATLRVDEPAPFISTFLSSLTPTDQLTRIDLSSLDQNETALLASGVAGYALDAMVASKVYHETEGNPLFVIETVRARLLDSTQGEKSTPPKVQSTILARMERLSIPARKLLDVAAVIGHDFAFDVLALACEQDEDAMTLALDELWQRRIIREQSATAYDFSHDTLRQVALEMMSAARRHLLHRHVAHAMEHVHASNLDAVSAEIAAHYEQAGNVEAAIRYWDRAANAARQIYAYAQAIEDYRHALALLNRETPSDFAAQLYENLGDLWQWTAQYDQARIAYQGVLDLIAESITRARTHRKIGNTYREQYLYQEALQVYAQANLVLNQTITNQSPEWWYEWIQTQLEIGLVYYWLGQVENSDRLHETLEPSIKQYGTATQRALFFQRIASTEFVRNRWVSTAQVIALGKAAVIAYKEAQNLVALPAAEFALGMQILWSNDPATAIELLENALRQAEQRGDTSLQARCLTYLTIAYRRIDQLEKAQSLATRSLQVAATINMPEYVATAKANLAWCALRESNFRSAHTLAREALAAWGVLPVGHASTPFQWLALFPLVAIELEAQHIEVAVGYVRVMLGPSQQKLPEELCDCLDQAVRNWDIGPPEYALDKLKTAIQLAQKMKYL